MTLLGATAWGEECPEWDSVTYYQVGDKVTYEGVGYEATEMIWCLFHSHWFSSLESTPSS